MKLKKIVAIGDSITWGFPYGTHVSWVVDLQKEFEETTFENSGVNGDTFNGIFYRLNEDVLALNPDGVIITAGINDLICGYHIDELKRVIDEILLVLKKNNIEVFLGIPINVPLIPALNNEINKLVHAIKEISKKNSLEIIDFQILNKNDFSDEVHPNKAGYKKMGDKVVMFFKNYFDQTKNGN